MNGIDVNSSKFGNRIELQLSVNVSNKTEKIEALIIAERKSRDSFLFHIEELIKHTKTSIKYLGVALDARGIFATHIPSQP